MPRPAPTWLLVALLLTASCATNRLNCQGDRTGRWRTSYDAASTQPQATGRYHHNQPVGRWRYYAQAGPLEREERFRRGGYSRLTYYYPTGRVWRRGRTRLADDGPALHYYWTGDWLIYSPEGRLQHIDTYERGRLVRRRAGRP